MKPMEAPQFLQNPQYRTDSQKSAQPSVNLRAEKLMRSEKFARKMLSAYPDYGKASPEYLLSVTEVLANYPEHIQARLADHMSGVPSKSEFLPSIAAIVKLGDEMASRDGVANRYQDLKRNAVPQIEYKGAYVPFPKLWEAFRDELDLLRGKRFDQLDDASKALATQGKDRARDILSKRYKQPGDAA